jgi:hypothetical protein
MRKFTELYEEKKREYETLHPLEDTIIKRKYTISIYNFNKKKNNINIIVTNI